MSKLVKYFGVNVKKGDYIFREGDPADVMYMIHKGKVQISKETGAFDEKIRILREGEFVGEMAVINKMPRSASAFAVEDCVLIKMDPQSFHETVQKNHEFAVSVIQLLSDRLRETDELLVVYAMQDRVTRLFSEFLLDMLMNGKRDASGGWGLVKRELFLKRVRERISAWSKDTIHSVLNEVISLDKISVKKDKNGTEWLAVKLEGNPFLQ